MSLSPQCRKVVDHIERWGSLNSIEAIRHYGITRLAARIFDLRDTNRAMKSVDSPDLAPGFVKYVPDFEQRRLNLQNRMNIELRSSNTPSEIAQINLKYATKFALLAAKSQETPA